MLKTQTLIKDKNDNIIYRWDDFLYEPSNTIIINNNVYENWEQYDEISKITSGWLVRTIIL